MTTHVFPYNIELLETPAFVCDLPALRRNAQLLAQVQQRGDCKILLALKGFAMWGVFDTLKPHLAGVTSSSVFEARLGREYFGKEVHGCAPAYSQADAIELAQLCDHVVFNSPAQLSTFGALVQRSGAHVELGLRLNHEHREVDVALYDPCAPRSRLGTTRRELDAAAEVLTQISGIHFHSLCELGSDALVRTWSAVEERFGDILPRMRWVNMGGGHHITRPGYDIDTLVALVQDVRQRFDVQVYLEPGEAVALNAGVLVTSVLDIVDNDGPIAILDTSATAHMPDVLEMPYRPRIVGGSEPGERKHTYRLGGLTCLAGDVIGDYSFDSPLRIGDKLIFEDMLHYTMVKTTMFNGVRHPALVTVDGDGTFNVLRRFGYDDYKSRLG